LRRALAPEGDSVVYQDRQIHVASWASKFLFAGEQLNQPVGKLSGGERARVLIAQLMLQPADVLLLDEPTNDLDIPTLDILEESLLEFRGSLVLVTHDRYMLDRVSTVVLGLDGQGRAGLFADYSQWESWLEENEQRARNDARPTSRTLVSVENTRQSPGKKKLSYLEAREYDSIEQRVADAELVLQAQRDQLEDPKIVSDGPRLVTAHAELEAAQEKVDQLYARWAELEKKKS
jgi:ATP-binding cassette subfamily F protein uup